jgi:hypothetical protein
MFYGVRSHDDHSPQRWVDRRDGGKNVADIFYLAQRLPKLYTND